MSSEIRMLLDRIVLLERVVERQATRMNNMIREARVVSVDHQTGTAIVDAHGVETAPVPWIQQAGSIVDWDPPAVGQRMVLFSPCGDLARGFLMPGGYTDDVGQPDNEGEMSSRTVGGTKIETRSDQHMVTTPTFRIKGHLIVEGDVDFSAGHVHHNGKSIGDDHKHGGIVPGQDLTDVPA